MNRSGTQVASHFGPSEKVPGSQALKTRLVRHAGVSFTPGISVVHFWTYGSDVDLIRRRWKALLTASGLAEELVFCRTSAGAIHGYSPAYVFLPCFLIQDVIEAAWEPGDPRDSELREQLELQSLDCSAYSRSYALHYRISQFRRWVAMPLMLGNRPSLFLGTGRFSRLMIMNVDQSASAAVALMGDDKACCRNLLMSQGIPVAPGATATTASGAAARARELGFPIVLKKSQGSGNSAGVIAGIENERDCIDAAAQLLADGQTLVVERMLEGIELRLHFICGRLFRILKSEPLTVTGDGVTSLAALLSRDHPDYFNTMSGTGYHRRRLILQLYRLGVREFSDLPRVVPRAGEVVRVSAAAGGAAARRLEPDAIHPADRCALEGFLTRFGSPSAGVDLILQRLGASLAEGGAILEINVPCGFAYLGDEAPHAADLELLETARRCPEFIGSGSRVPLELAVSDEFPPGSNERAALVDQFSEHYKGACVTSLSRSDGWLPILTNAGASALLVFVDEAAIEEHGMPINLQPVVRCSRPRSEFEARYPLLCATAVNAGGIFRE
jgi:hypothetical protein